MLSEDFEALRGMLGPALRSQLPAELLEEAWRTTTSVTGEGCKVGAITSEDTNAGITTVSVPVTCEQGGLTVVVAFDAQRLIVRLRLNPIVAQVDRAPPAYVDADEFSEHAVEVTANELAVNGSLCIPHAATPVPAVVLLAGSGPADRDGTLGPNKPLRDLAWGLATCGIATLRYDKVTHAHPEHFIADTNASVVDEYVNHAHAALALITARSEIDPTRVFLAGHSLGGTVAPRIAAASTVVTGLVILAGATQPLHHAALRQVRYLASLNPNADVDDDPSIVTLAQQVSRVDSLATSTPAAGDLPFGVPASYWRDLLAYDPAGTAATLDIPILILQGGRDYQVTIDDDLHRWRSALSTRSDVTISVYPNDDHQFFAGQGLSTPLTYRDPQHVDSAVINDIASWITSRDTVA